MTLYLDTSSLIKLYVSEEGSEDVRARVDAAAVVATASIAYTEARAALARRRRERTLGAAGFASVKKALEADWHTYFTIEATSTLCGRAAELADRYRLRAYDSVHLAAFAEVAREAGVRDTEFSSFDMALSRAARSLHRTLARSH